jgi:hypothetical protein
MATDDEQRFIGMKRMESAGNGSKSNASSTSKRNSAPAKKQVLAALCLKNEGCGDLELRKLYRIVRDRRATTEGYLRIIDESGEDYLYPAAFFAIVRIPSAAAKTLLLVA